MCESLSKAASLSHRKGRQASTIDNPKMNWKLVYWALTPYDDGSDLGKGDLKLKLN